MAKFCPRSFECPLAVLGHLYIMNAYLGQQPVDPFNRRLLLRKLKAMQGQRLYTILYGVINNVSSFYLPCKKWFFHQLANISSFMRAVIFCLLKNYHHMQKMMSVEYWCLQIWSGNLHNWHFLEIFVQIPKNNSSQCCIKCIFAALK